MYITHLWLTISSFSIPECWESHCMCSPSYFFCKCQWLLNLKNIRIYIKLKKKKKNVRGVLEEITVWFVHHLVPCHMNGSAHCNRPLKSQLNTCIQESLCALHMLHNSHNYHGYSGLRMASGRRWRLWIFFSFFHPINMYLAMNERPVAHNGRGGTGRNKTERPRPSSDLVSEGCFFLMPSMQAQWI